MYARGMSQRDISSTIENIYGFKISHDMVSDITEPSFPKWKSGRTDHSKKCYPFVFVDCMYVSVRNDYEAKEEAVYMILGYDLQGQKEILGLWMDSTESKNYWMQVFDEIKARGLKISFSFLWMACPVLNRMIKLFFRGCRTKMYRSSDSQFHPICTN